MDPVLSGALFGRTKSMPRYEITVAATFNATHALRLPDGSFEPAHGHDWHVTATLGSDTLDAMDCVVDFHAAEAALQRIVAPWHHGDLNRLDPFYRSAGLAINPSAERVAEVVLERLTGALADIRPEARVLAVSTTEAPGCLARVRA